MNKRIKILGDGADGRRYQVDLTEVELGLMSDLLNSVNDLRAVPLRQAVEGIIRGNNLFSLEQRTKIVQCTDCDNSGYYYVYDDFRQKELKHTCQKCRGEGQRVEITAVRYEPLSPFWREKLAKRY